MASGELCTCRLCREKPINQGLWVVSEEHRAVLERAQAQNAALMAVLEAASDAEWSYYSNREGDRYCVECDRLIASGPHSPNPHADDCRWGELWEAIKEARATLEAQP